MSKIKIFVSHRIDQNNITFENEIYTPVRCGAVYDDDPNPEILGDDTGINISDKRPFLGEFTVQYWAWKNVEADYYGLCHYRRYLSFSDTRYPTDEKAQVIEKKLTEHSFKKFNLTDTEKIEKEVSQYDAVVAEYADISGMYTPKGPRPTVYEHFAAYDQHLINKDDIDLFLETFATLYPDMKDMAEEYFNGNKFRGFNCFILKKEYFEELCKMEVEILRAIEKTKKIDFTYRSDLQSRTYGFFTEWIYGLFIYSLEKRNKKIKYKQLVFFDHTEKTVYPEQKKDTITVAIETNRWLLPATTVTIQSALDNRSPKDKYDFIIFHTELSKFEQNKTKEFFEKNENVSITFVNLKSATPVCDNGIYWDYINKASHLVYLIPWMLKKHNRVIYLHADTLVKADLKQLFLYDLEGKAIAAPRDFIRMAEHRQNPKLYNFRKHKLSMKDPYDYFSSSTVVFDLDLVRSQISLEDCVRFSMDSFYNMDVMNRLFNGNVKFLDAKWNTIVETTGSLKLISEYIPKKHFDELRQAQKNPAVLHFLSNPKPWQDTYCDMATDFWEVARRTPFYERMIQNIVMGMAPVYHPYTPVSEYKPSRTVRFFKKILPKRLHPFAKKAKNLFTRK